MQVSYKKALLAHAQNLPRYTSYPPANFFTPLKDPDEYYTVYSALSPFQPISLYIHIPFCPKMCWFCGCHTQATARYDPIPNYLELLYKEIKFISDTIPADIQVSHIHFGGGSPTILTPDNFTSLMNHIRDHFKVTDHCQIAIEIDPRQITSEKMMAYRNNGVNRISLGVQDIDHKVMAAINRVQPFDIVRKAIDLCRSYNFMDINVDLVYGLPHQSCETMIDTVSAVCDLLPTRLALFGYAHVPWLKKHMRLIADIDLPDLELRYDLVTAASDVIESRGYIPIGIDHFAQSDDALTQSQKLGQLKRNFQGYVPASEDLPIIGLGVSSISQTPYGYIQNTSHMPHYRDAIQAGQLPIVRGHILSLEDRLHADIIERLMCDATVNLSTILRRHPGTMIDIARINDRLFPLIRDRLVEMTPDGNITVHHRLAVRMVAHVFDVYAVQQVKDSPSPRHASAI